MNPTDPRHGTVPGYQAGCRNHCCRAAKATDQAHRARMRAYGRPTTDLVDIGPVRAHLTRLKDAGISLETIARTTGVTPSTVQRVVYGRRNAGSAERVRAASARALLALRPADAHLPDLSLVDASGARRRSQALQVLGHSLRDQADALGYHEDSYRLALRGDRVSIRLARAVRWLYEQWWNTTAPETAMNTRTRRRAEALGYLPPMAWDEELIDLPDDQLAAEVERQVSAMDETELGRCYRAVLAGERSPVMAAAAPRYLEVTAAKKRARRTAA